MISDVLHQFEDVETVAVDREKLLASHNESIFLGKSVDLMKEIGSYVCILGHIHPPEGWSRDQAILGGHLIRLFKLIHGLLDQTCQRRREAAMVFCRLTAETVINIMFLSRFSSADIFSSYIAYSMKHEKKLYEKIKANIAQRKSELPIETRMLVSIERKSVISGMRIEEMSSNKPQNWGGKNLYEKAEAVGLSDAYLGIIGGPSHSIHGNWMDLLEYHLVEKDGKFTPKGDWKEPRPQVLLSLSKLVLEALVDYLGFIGHIELRNSVLKYLTDAWERVREVDELHENYLQRR